jgi:hypothetical protein
MKSQGLVGIKECDENFFKGVLRKVESSEEKCTRSVKK